MNLRAIGKSVREHPLMQVLANNGGNPRTLVLIEPLWGIPYNLISPFATLYMYAQGITDVQIGLILSVTMVVQVFFSFFAAFSPRQKHANTDITKAGIFPIAS